MSALRPRKIRMEKNISLAKTIHDNYWELPGYKQRNYCTDTARKFGVSRATIQKIVNAQGNYEILERDDIMTPTATALALMKERNIHTCQVKGCNRPAMEAHHCLYGKKKGIVELNWYENLQLVCIECHRFNGNALTFENRLDYWNWACEFYGKEHMVAWHNDLPLTIKEKAYK